MRRPLLRLSSRNTPLLSIALLLAAAQCVFWAARPATAVVIYDFENLAPGPIVGQDNWAIQFNGSVVIESGTGSNSSLIASNPGSQAWVERQNDANFSFGFTGSETAAFIQYDMRWQAVASPTLWFSVFLDGSGAGTSPQLGFQIDPFGATSDGFVIREANYGTVATAVGVPGAQPDDWVTARLTMDFTANGGAGLGSVSYRNLTQGDAGFTPLAGLQNIDLDMASTNPALWDTINLRTEFTNANSEIDNIVIGVIPEPSTALLLGLGLAGLHAWRRTRPHLPTVSLKPSEPGEVAEVVVAPVAISGRAPGRSGSSQRRPSRRTNPRSCLARMSSCSMARAASRRRTGWPLREDLHQAQDLYVSCV